ncbi:hypothetical protein GTW40_24325 [Streptomyces sp. SID4985]|nr:hypothetical protein [Streptomyces sp. SID4985]MYQ48133.1 hypothetical protein [Streptomyces sp. SID4985]
MARVHLSQLIEMFGTDGCLRIDTTWVEPASATAEADSATVDGKSEEHHE